jgi:hypothetical protein
MSKLSTLEWAIIVFGLAVLSVFGYLKYTEIKEKLQSYGII